MSRALFCCQADSDNEVDNYLDTLNVEGYEREEGRRVSQFERSAARKTLAHMCANRFYLAVAWAHSTDETGPSQLSLYYADDNNTLRLISMVVF